ncbi:transmembrane protein, putative (macronuclear) [Tetrahymena thermophila SB210]|uniref:Transmembrane protein, putative n=1 Tax=Tetrahymena thermophila (strain SB210) TaxID=312017 RepID=W7XJ74_TETTS|nr:transmembrane protein, putative [Tetrahymena thermophila SB210]EWS75276.1 transmembrane protein, putative [Tetrahymena thermophila SB210]|eukprot:XP_012652267.1 transmembrane protein, putative [Tetrahymena thermophila SB210]
MVIQGLALLNNTRIQLLDFYYRLFYKNIQGALVGEIVYPLSNFILTLLQILLQVFSNLSSIFIYVLELVEDRLIKEIKIRLHVCNFKGVIQKCNTNSQKSLQSAMTQAFFIINDNTLKQIIKSNQSLFIIIFIIILLQSSICIFSINVASNKLFLKEDKQISHSRVKFGHMITTLTPAIESNSKIAQNQQAIFELLTFTHAQ